MKKLVLLVSVLSIFKFDIVTNGDGYYINETANRAFIVETVFNDVEPLFLYVID